DRDDLRSKKLPSRPPSADRDYLRSKNYPRDRLRRIATTCGLRNYPGSILSVPGSPWQPVALSQLPPATPSRDPLICLDLSPLPTMAFEFFGRGPPLSQK